MGEPMRVGWVGSWGLMENMERVFEPEFMVKTY